MNRRTVLAGAIVCIFIIFVCTSYYVLNLESGPGRAFYLTEPRVSNGTVSVSVSNSTNPLISEIYVGFNTNDGGGAIHPDEYTRCVGELDENTTMDWIAFNDNDSDDRISINDSFVISLDVLSDQTVQNLYMTDGYINIAFSNEEMAQYLAMINIDTSDI